MFTIFFGDLICFSDFLADLGLKLILSLGLFFMTKLRGIFSGEKFFLPNHLSGGRGIVAKFREEVAEEAGISEEDVNGTVDGSE